MRQINIRSPALFVVHTRLYNTVFLYFTVLMMNQKEKHSQNDEEAAVDEGFSNLTDGKAGGCGSSVVTAVVL